MQRDSNDLHLNTWVGVIVQLFIAVECNDRSRFGEYKCDALFSYLISSKLLFQDPKSHGYHNQDSHQVLKVHCKGKADQMKIVKNLSQRVDAAQSFVARSTVPNRASFVPRYGRISM